MIEAQKSIDLQKIAKDLISRIEGLERQALADHHYYRGAKDGVNSLLEAIAVELKGKPEEVSSDVKAEAKADEPQA